MQVIEAGTFATRCRGRNGEEIVNMMLIGPQPVGTWVLNFLGSAREVLTEAEAASIDRALDGLSAIMSGEEIADMNHYFPALREEDR